ncbi:MAG: Shikimate kinase [Bacteroidetes bacterium]|jgi:shikimate kinase|nr:Shikimate kinase [Bacteroidota bacterium]
MEEKKLVFMCGFMGCGKTTQGKKLAKELGYYFIDLDDYISNKYDQTITELFKEKGEAEFRKIETEALGECVKDNLKALIAVGGGTPCFNNNMELMVSNGKVIYLKMNAEALYNRLFNAKEDRPLIRDKTNEEMFLYIENLLKTREAFYEQAQIITSGVTVDIEALKEKVLTHTT